MKIFNLCWASRRARRGTEDLISWPHCNFRIAAKADANLSTDRQHQQPFSSETMTHRVGFGGDQLRTRTLERDGLRCQRCESSVNLQVHHLRFRGRLGSDVPDNLITLCADCHSKEHHENSQIPYEAFFESRVSDAPICNSRQKEKPTTPTGSNDPTVIRRCSVPRPIREPNGTRRNKSVTESSR